MRVSVIVLGIAMLSSGCAETPLGSNDDVPQTDVYGAEPLAATLDLASPTDTAPPGVSIDSFTTGGTGCADVGSLTIVITADGTAFLVIFDEMTLAHPPGPPVKHRSCVANIRLQVPPGWRFSVQTANTRGYVYLSPDQTARIDSMYFFSGSPPGGMFSSSLTGPLDTNYTFTDDISSAGGSKCGGQAIFHLHTKLTLDVVKNKNEPAILNADSVDARFVKTLSWQWERC